MRLGNVYFYGVVGQNFADRVQEPFILVVYKRFATSVQPGCLGGVWPTGWHSYPSHLKGPQRQRRGRKVGLFLILPLPTYPLLRFSSHKTVEVQALEICKVTARCEGRLDLRHGWLLGERPDRPDRFTLVRSSKASGSESPTSTEANQVRQAFSVKASVFWRSYFCQELQITLKAASRSEAETWISVFLQSRQVLCCVGENLCHNCDGEIRKKFQELFWLKIIMSNQVLLLLK